MSRFASGLAISLLLIPVLTFALTVNGVGAQPLNLPPEYNPLVYKRLQVVVRALDDGSILVNITATLRNEGKVMVVPGYGLIPLRIESHKRFLGLPLPSKVVANRTVKVVKARSFSTGKEMEALVLEENRTKVIRYALWQPLKPKQEESFNIVFMVDGAVERGFLFHELGFSLGPLSNKVIAGSLKVLPPPGMGITFSEPKSQWDLSGMHQGGVFKATVEFSQLPLPKLPFHGYYLVWGGLIILMLAIILVRWRRR